MDPRFAEANGLFDRGEFAAALAAYDAELSRCEDARGRVNRGYCGFMLERHDQAEEDFRSALRLDARRAEAWVGLGDVAAARMAHSEAVDCYDRALSLEPSLAVARNNRSQSLAALGRLRDAWQDAEVRYELPNASALYPHRLALPRWDGSPGRRVLVHWEQGFGDILQHLRFLPLLAARTAGAAFECPPPLLRLARRMPGVPRLIEATASPPSPEGFDAVAPLASLPWLLGVDPARLPAAPYLLADGNAAGALRARWNGRGKTVGLVWRASRFDERRSLPLEELAAVEQSGVRLVSLQPDPSPEERAVLAGRGIVEAGSVFRDFDDTAAALAAVECLVTVDTAAAHLAGALGRPTLVLLNEPPAARWMTGREDTPWYASARLLRKRAGEPWRTPVDEARSRIGKLLP